MFKGGHRSDRLKSYSNKQSKENNTINSSIAMKASIDMIERKNDNSNLYLLRIERSQFSPGLRTLGRISGFSVCVF